MIEHADPGCPHGHLAGLRGFSEGEPARVTGVGECHTLVFERQSRTAMLLPRDEPRVSSTNLRRPD